MRRITGRWLLMLMLLLRILLLHLMLRHGRHMLLVPVALLILMLMLMLMLCPERSHALHVRTPTSRCCSTTVRRTVLRVHWWPLRILTGQGLLLLLLLLLLLQLSRPLHYLQKVNVTCADASRISCSLSPTCC